MYKQRGFADVLIIIVVLLLVIFGGYYVAQQYTDKKNAECPSTGCKTHMIYLENNDDIKLKDNEIYYRDNLLFTNVTNVDEIRIGPKTGTLHFHHPQQINEPQINCIDFINEIFPYPHLKDKNLPGAWPWDYKEFAQNYQYTRCSNGYLTNSKAFSYIKVNEDKTGTLIFELNGETTEIPISSQVLDSLRVETEGITVGSDVLTNQDYLYHGNDSYIFNNKIILSYGRLILAFDLETKRVIGSLYLDEENYEVVSDAFWFIGKENHPLTVVEAGWEGYRGYQTILDLSGDELKTERIYKYDKSVFDFNDIKDIEWGGDSIVITFPTEENLNSYVKDLIDKVDFENPADNEDLEKQAIERLESLNSYLNIYCDFEPNMLTPACYGVTEINKYRYTTSGSFGKI